MGTIAAPIMVSPAFEDRDAIWRMIRTHSPYPLMAALAGYGELLGADVTPWFRSNWALDGQAVDDETMALLHHEAFIDATKRLFAAAVVRPSTIVTNVNGPMAVGPPHVDTTIGDSEAFAARVRVTRHSTIRCTDRGDWEITIPDGPAQAVPAEDIRVSILWKALTFGDEREARVYDDHEDDLDLATIVDRLRADLAARGHVVAEPSDPYRDAEWSRVLTSVYFPGRST